MLWQRVLYCLIVTLNSLQQSKVVLQSDPVELKPPHSSEECQLSAAALCTQVVSSLTLTFTVSLTVPRSCQGVADGYWSGLHQRRVRVTWAPQLFPEIPYHGTSLNTSASNAPNLPPEMSWTPQKERSSALQVCFWHFKQRNLKQHENLFLSLDFVFGVY